MISSEETLELNLMKSLVPLIGVCVFVCVGTHAWTLSCPTLCNSLNYSPPGFTVHRLFQVVSNSKYVNERFDPLSKSKS